MGPHGPILRVRTTAVHRCSLHLLADIPWLTADIWNPPVTNRLQPAGYVMAAIGHVPLDTDIVGWCPIYSVLRIGTNSDRSEIAARATLKVPR